MNPETGRAGQRGRFNNSSSAAAAATETHRSIRSDSSARSVVLGRQTRSQCDVIRSRALSLRRKPRRAFNTGYIIRGPAAPTVTPYSRDNGTYIERERSEVGGGGGGREIEGDGEKVERIFQFFVFDYSLVGVGRSRRYCNTGPTRGEVGASSCIFSQFQKSV